MFCLPPDSHVAARRRQQAAKNVADNSEHTYLFTGAIQMNYERSYY